MIHQPAIFVIEPMDSWISFLQQQGAHLASDGTQSVHCFDSTNPVVPVVNFMVPLTGLGLIAATGEDAVSFLHNQLTNDISHLGTDETRLAGYCTPKGRLLATFLVWKTAQTILLQLPLSLQATVQKRLQMFVMRSKVTLDDHSVLQVQLGLAGPAAATLLQTWFPQLPDKPFAKIDGPHGTLIRLADTATLDSSLAAGVVRYLWMTTATTAQDAWPVLLGTLQPAGTPAWDLTEIRTAIPTITSATQDKFVPQMINFEAVGGVNFQKGCYPGQEIVARSQYLGKLKRRLMPATVASIDACAGMPLFSVADPEQACGMVVNAAPTDSATSACLVEIKLAALASDVHLGTKEGPLLRFYSLPYPLADADRPELR